jgi:D-xylose transport system permease protein
MLPIIIGLAALVAYFQIRNSVFLSAGNLVNLFVQATIFILLGMAEIWLLLLGEIDLSVGFVAALGAATSVILLDTQFHWAWYLALPLSVAVTTLIGMLQGFIVIKLRLPSFIVTLAGQIGWEGLLIYLVDRQGTGGTIPVNEKVLYYLVNGNVSTVMTWAFFIAIVTGACWGILRKDVSRRASGLEATPRALMFAKMGLLAIGGFVLAMIFNTNRGTFIPLRGMPWAILIDFVLLGAGSFMLNRTRMGRYIYAIGGNAEAARRAGINVNRYRLLAFTLTGFTAGIAGLLYASRLGGISDGIDGGTLVLYAVASAVIGGTSLFGGRGKIVHALVGGLVIATIYNGMALIGMSAATQYIATAFVLLAAVAIDSIARRGSANLR